MDIVFIEQLSVITTIGVYDWEQTIEQKLVFDIEMGWDNRKSAKSDDVNDCLSYADISETVIAHVEGQRFALVERVAEEVAPVLTVLLLLSLAGIALVLVVAVAHQDTSFRLLEYMA